MVSPRPSNGFATSAHLGASSRKPFFLCGLGCGSKEGALVGRGAVEGKVYGGGSCERVRGAAACLTILAWTR